MTESQLSKKKLIVFGQFKGMNTQTDRHALPEDTPAWLENLQPIAPNNLKNVPSPSDALTSIAGEVITRQFYAPINNITYLVCFCVSGAAYAVNLSTGTKTKFANAGTFSLKPDMTTWNQQRILIADATAGYSTWDGTTFIQQGNVSPNIQVTNGGSYAGTPTVTISGGSGSGATAVPVLVAGVVTAITLTNPGTGYLPGDTLTVAFSGGSPNGGTILRVNLTNGGNGYTSLPTVVFTPTASGSGAAAVSSVLVSGGPVASVTLTNPGSGYNGPVTVSFTGGAGANAAAHAVVSSIAEATAVVFPFISPNPTSIAVFQGRVFLSVNNVLTYTGTQGFDDVSPANGAGTFTVSDADLVTSITAVRSLNNYLYVIGDNSVKQIGNLSVSGSITLFTLVTLSSDQGTIFQSSIISFNRLLLFANTVGVYAVFGSSVEKISGDMDGIFQNIDFTQEPVAAVNDINSIHTYMLLVRYMGPGGVTRSIILAQSDKKWFVISQGNSLKYMVTCPIKGITETFATSSNDITQLLNAPTIPIAITLITALSPHQEPWMGKNSIRGAIAQLSNASANSFTIEIDSENGSKSVAFLPTTSSINFVNNVGATINFQNNLNQTIQFYSANQFTYFSFRASNVQGIYLGATLTGTASNYSLNTIMLEYKDTAFFGVNG